MSHPFLTFTLADSHFAVEVTNVQEVLEYQHITRVPCADTWMEGLISSRGQGISVVNMRRKFALDDREPDKNTRIIVMELRPTEDETVIFGAIADSVQEVIEIADEEIEPPPKFGNTIATRFIRGIAKREGEFIIVLNAEQIFSQDELDDITETEESVPVEEEEQSPEG
ncbi:MAG: chemotaxis protein CheW [Treponema sp.]|nr:chemotaxis protein CheW [Candidatus Treponema caballi]